MERRQRPKRTTAMAPGRAVLMSTSELKQRCLTCELSGHQQRGARPVRQMINNTAARAWRHAVGAPLERGVRQHRAQLSVRYFLPNTSNRPPATTAPIPAQSGTLTVSFCFTESSIGPIFKALLSFVYEKPP
jgi:hypothetical protein